MQPNEFQSQRDRYLSDLIQSAQIYTRSELGDDQPKLIVVHTARAGLLKVDCVLPSPSAFAGDGPDPSGTAFRWAGNVRVCGRVTHAILSLLWKQPIYTVAEFYLHIWGRSEVNTNTLWSRIKVANRILLDAGCGRQICVRHGYILLD